MLDRINPNGTLIRVKPTTTKHKVTSEEPKVTHVHTTKFTPYQMKRLGVSFLKVVFGMFTPNQNAATLRDAETKFLGHKNDSHSEKNYSHLTVRSVVPREARRMLKIDRDGEMSVTTAPAPAPEPAAAVPATAATAAATSPAAVAVLDATGGDEPARKCLKVNLLIGKYAEGGLYMSMVDGWMASGIEREWIWI